MEIRTPTLPFRLNGYMVEEELGRGGQAVVYRARDEQLDADVAIKWLLPEYRTPDSIERLRKEAQFLVRLNHPNVVRFFALDTKNYFLVLEYCDGGDLARLINRRRPLSLDRVISITRQICEGLAHAFEIRPTAHRDVKPENILFKDGLPKVSDFGLAKALHDSSTATQTKGTMGTPMYMSPEQWHNPREVDGRTDLWSVGVMLHKMLTWKHPFADSAIGLDPVPFSVKVRTAPPDDPPFEVPAAIMEVVRKALSKEPDDRYDSAEAMIEALDRARAAVDKPDEIMLPPMDQVGALEREASEAWELIDGGQSEEAQRLVTRMKKENPATSLVAYLAREVRKLRSTISDEPVPPENSEDSKLRGRVDSITSLMGQGEFEEVRQELGELRREGVDIGQLLLQLQEQEQRFDRDFRAVSDKASQCRADRDLQGALDVWEELRARYPKNQRVRNERLVARSELDIQDKQEALERLDQDVQSRSDEGDFAAAVAAVRAFLERFPDDEQGRRLLDPLEQKLEAVERAKRLARLQAAAEALERAGRLDEARDAWNRVLRESPENASARDRIEVLDERIRGEELEARLGEVQAKAGRLEGAGDLAGAVRIWEGFLEVYPDVEEAASELRRLRDRRDTQRRHQLRLRLDGLRSELESRASGHRYRSLEVVDASVTRTLRMSEAREDADPDVMAEATDALSRTLADAESRLSQELEAWRAELRERWRAGTESLGCDPAMLGAEASATERAVSEALGATIAALSATGSAAIKGDPLDPLAQSGRRLKESVESLHRERQVAAEQAQARCWRALEATQDALQVLEEGLARKVDAGGVEDLRKELRRLNERAESNLPAELAEVERDAQTFVARCRSIATVATWKLVVETRNLGRRVRSVLLEVPDPELCDGLRRASKALDGDALDDGRRVKELLECRDTLAKRLTDVQSNLEVRMRTAQTRWNTAINEWTEILTRDLAVETRARGEEVRASGQAAVIARRAADLEAWAEQMEGLIRRYRLEGPWIECQDVVVGMEGPVDRDGLPLKAPTPEVQRLLAQYRGEVIAGEWESARSLAELIRRRRDEGELNEEWQAGELLTLSPKTRRLNERLQPAELERFDTLQARYETAVAEERKAEAVSLETELGRASRRLLEPPPVLPRALFGFVGLVTVALALFLIFNGSSNARRPTTPVALLTLAGQVSPVLHHEGGARVESESRVEIREEARILHWDLPDGRYELRNDEDAVLRTFTVPDDTRLLLPPGQRDWMEQKSKIARELKQMLNEGVD